MTSPEPVLPRVSEYLDCTGRLLRFEITQGPQTDGVVVTARQLDPETEPGYEFSAWSATRGDALGKLHHKIKAGISRRYLGEHPRHGLSLLTDGFSGIVAYGGVTIDGRHVPFGDIIDLLQTYEGWGIELRITTQLE